MRLKGLQKLGWAALVALAVVAPAARAQGPAYPPEAPANASEYGQPGKYEGFGDLLQELDSGMGDDGMLFSDEESQANEYVADPEDTCYRCGMSFSQGLCTCRPVNMWYLQADGTFLRRNSPRLNDVTRIFRTIVFNQQEITLQVVMQSTRDLDFQFEPGARLTLGRFLGTDAMRRDHSVEFTFQGFQQYSTSSSVTAPGQTVSQINFNGIPLLVLSGNLFSYFSTDVAGFNRATIQGQQYSSNFSNYELNYRIRRQLNRDAIVASPDGRWTRRSSPGFTPSFLIGLRSIAISEHYRFFSQGAGEVFTLDGQPVGNYISSGNYQIRTTNNLYGVQVGGDLIRQESEFSYGARGKAGLYADYATQKSNITASDLTVFPSPAGTYSANRTHIAFVGEFGFVGTWRLRPYLNVRAAYDFLWVQSALAPEQITTTVGAPPKVNVGGFTFYQGPSLGAELIW